MNLTGESVQTIYQIGRQRGIVLGIFIGVGCTLLSALGFLLLLGK